MNNTKEVDLVKSVILDIKSLSEYVVHQTTFAIGYNYKDDKKVASSLTDIFSELKNLKRNQLIDQKRLEEIILMFEKTDPFTMDNVNLFLEALEDSTKFLKKVVSKISKGKYLTFDGTNFMYNKKKLPINPGTHMFILLETLYNLFPEHTGKVSYEDLFELLREKKKYKNQSDEQLRVLIRTRLTSRKNNDSVSWHLEKFEKNGKPLIETERGEGIKFNNS